jgi:glycosyltransferase 2 family protein
MKLNKTLKFLLKAAVSLGFVAWIVLKTNWPDVLTNIGRIKVWQIAIYITAVLAGMLISAYKWKMLAEHKKINRPLKDFFKLYLAGTLINNLMPSFIGGDTFRAYQIGKDGKKYMEAASTVLIDRITGFVGASILVLIFSLINIKVILQNNILILINSLLLVSLFFDVLIAKARKFAFRPGVSKYIPDKLTELIKELDHYSNGSGILSRAVIWSVLFAIVGVAAANYVLFLSLGAKIGILNYLCVIFLISIVSAIPISINNIGIKEWAYVTFFGFFGVNSSVVVAIAIVSRFLQMLLSFLALPAYLESKTDKH